MFKKVHTLKRSNPAYRLAGAILIIVFVAIASIVFVRYRDRQTPLASPCSGQVIQDYNHVMRFKTTADYQSGFRALAERIESLKGSKNDISCAYILYEYYSYVGNFDKTKEYVSAFEAMSTAGHKLDGAIPSPDGLPMMNDKLRGLDPTQSNDAGGRG